MPAMPATVRKLAISDSLVDINEASANELRDALPGIGDILARRIVAYRSEHGPFEHPDDLMRVPGLNGKRISKLAPRMSLAPNSGFRVPAANQTSIESGGPAADDYVHPMPIFSIESEPLPQQHAPSMSSLLPDGPEESIGTSVLPSAPPGSYLVGASVLSAAPRSFSASAGPTLAAPPQTTTATDDDELFSIPLQRPARVAVLVVALGLFSALVGSIFGIRSQEGGPRARVEQRIGQVEGNVSDLAGSVKALEGKASAFASSINALDQRVTEKSHEVPRASQTALPKVETPSARVETPAAASPGSESRTSAVRRRVRQAMRELDPIAPAPRDP